MHTSAPPPLPLCSVAPLPARLLLCACVSMLAAAAAMGHAQTRRAPSPAGAAADAARTERAFERARAAGSPELYAFLHTFPKGGDLHMHLSGAVYAETFLREAVDTGLCIDPAALRLAAAPAAGAGCAAPLVPASAAMKDQVLYDKLVDSFSMRGFVPSAGTTGHDQFFATFARFGAARGHDGEWLAEAATRAAEQNEQYLEIMQTPPFTHAATLGYKLGLPAHITLANHMAVFADARERLLRAGVRDEVDADREAFRNAEQDAAKLEGCTAAAAAAAATTATAAAQRPATANSPAACDIEVRWLYQVLRAFPPEQVFAQTLLGFETVAAEMRSGHAHVVGINFVQPEDARIARDDYTLQMLMLDYLHSVYPEVHISLHAGELQLGMVPPADTAFHIREAIELGHAERIGHGVDVLYERDAAGLLRLMAARHIDVEINLTSNAVILGVASNESPFAAYRAAGVPYSLSTDDEGVSRIDLTHEYVRAVREQGLGYADLKLSARDALEYSFLAGASLWQPTGAAPQMFAHRVSACAAPIDPQARIPQACQELLAASDRARAQYELERRLAVFEEGPH